MEGVHGSSMPTAADWRWASREAVTPVGFVLTGVGSWRQDLVLRAVAGVFVHETAGICKLEGGHAWQETLCIRSEQIGKCNRGRGGQLTSRTSMGVQIPAREKALSQVGLGYVGPELLGLP